MTIEIDKDVRNADWLKPRMKVDIFCINRGAKQYIAGTLEVRDGAVVGVPMTEDARDHRTLQWVASRTIYVLIGGEDCWVDPATEPEKFLTFLHRALFGTYVRAGKMKRELNG